MSGNSATIISTLLMYQAVHWSMKSLSLTAQPLANLESRYSSVAMELKHGASHCQHYFLVLTCYQLATLRRSIEHSCCWMAVPRAMPMPRRGFNCAIYLDPLPTSSLFISRLISTESLGTYLPTILLFQVVSLR